MQPSPGPPSGSSHGTQAQPLAPSPIKADSPSEKRENVVTLNSSDASSATKRSNNQIGQATPSQSAREKRNHEDTAASLDVSAQETEKHNHNTTTALLGAFCKGARANATQALDRTGWLYVGITMVIQNLLADVANTLGMASFQMARYATRQAMMYLTPVISVLLVLHFLEPHIPFHVRPAIDSVSDFFCVLDPISSICPIFFCASWNLVHLFPSICVNIQIHSAGQAFGDNFALPHQDLARVIAYTNAVHSAPQSLLHHRTQMYEILQRLPKEAYKTRENIYTFLNQTEGMPVSLQHFIYEIQGIGTLAVRQYGFTKDLIVTVRNTPTQFRFVRAWKWLMMSPSEEEIVRNRLLDQADVTLSAVRKGIESATQQLFLHNALTATTSDIKISATADKERSWNTKAEIMAGYDVLIRFVAQYGIFHEPTTTANVNKNLMVADEVLTWSTGMKQWLNLTLPGLQDTEAGLTFLQKNLLQQNKVIRFGRPGQSGKDYVLDEFLDSFDSGVQLLLSSTEAWQQLRKGKYI